MKRLLVAITAACALFAAGHAQADCGCLDADGNALPDPPLAVFSSADPSHALAVCGHVEKRAEGKVLASRVAIKACGAKESVFEPDPGIQAEIELRADAVVVTQIEQLPTGKNWTWEPHPFVRYELRFDDKGAVAKHTSVVLAPPQFPPKRVKEVLAEYDKALEGRSRVSDDLPYKILLIALAGSEEAAGKMPIMKEELHLEGPTGDAAIAALGLFQIYSREPKAVAQQ